MAPWMAAAASFEHLTPSQHVHCCPRWSQMPWTRSSGLHVSAFALAQSSKLRPWGMLRGKRQWSLIPWQQGEEIGLLQGLDLHDPDQEAQFGDRDPLLVLGLASVSSVTSAWPWPQLRPWPGRCCKILHRSCLGPQPPVPGPSCSSAGTCHLFPQRRSNRNNL